MSEVADLVSLVFEVIELADAAIRGCKKLVEAIRDAPKDLRVLLLTVSTFKALLQHVDSFMGTSEVARERKHLAGQVQQAKDILEEMDLLLAKPEDLLSKEKHSLTKMRGAWMLNSNQGKFAKSLEDLRRCQESINAILTADTCEIVRGIAVDVCEIKDKLSVVERDHILDALVTVDPSENHRRAWELHEPVTSEWITRSNQWKAWIEGDTRLWWIEGIPGAGKTVLASYVIETVKALAEQHASCWEPTIGWTYYYCYHARTHKSEVEPFLRWIVSDLARKAEFIPPAVTDNRRHLGTEHLFDALGALSERFDKVFITIDALDECQDRSAFFGLIRRLHSSPAHRRLRILATSRGEADIRRAFEPISTCLSMKNDLLDQDIANYIRSQLSSDTAFEPWGDKLRHEVTSCLVAKSTGMFRWVSCQLEILKHLKQPSLVMQALDDLPEDLNATYERILLRIPKCSRPLARNALALVCANKLGNPHELLPEVLSEAVRWTVTKSGTPADALLGVDALFELCICLLTKDADGKVCLAHRSVGEYLQSEHVPGEFLLLRETCTKLFLKTVTNRLLCPEILDFLPSSTFWDYCALRFELWIMRHDGVIARHEDLFEQVIELLKSGNGHVFRIATKLASRYSAGDVLFWTSLFYLGKPSREEGSLEHVARLCMAGAWDVFDAYISQYDPAERAALWSARTAHPVAGDCSVIEFAAYQGRNVLLEQCLQNGAKLDSNSQILLHLCDTYTYRSHAQPSEWLRRVFQLVLDSGAGPNPKNVHITPLQLAVSHREVHWVSMLLAAGADPNAVADASPVDWPTYLPVRYTVWFHFHLLLATNPKIPFNAGDAERDLDIWVSQNPLDICRQALTSDDPDLRDYCRPETEEIERILLRYGATESEPARGSKPECEPDSRVSPVLDIEVPGSELVTDGKERAEGILVSS